MKANDVFPEQQEREQVKKFIEMFKGTLTQVLDENKKVLFQSEIMFDN